VTESVDRVIERMLTASTSVDASNQVPYNLKREQEQSPNGVDKILFRASVSSKTRTNYKSDMKTIIRVVFGMHAIDEGATIRHRSAMSTTQATLLYSKTINRAALSLW
jgi:uncharacterized membrane protein YheB (UPF0754 family)